MRERAREAARGRRRGRRARPALIKQAIAAFTVAALILAVGIGYAATRDPSYSSTAQMVIVAGPSTPSSAIANFERSGTAETLAEVIDSAGTFREAGNPPVALEVQLLPDSTVLQLTSEGKLEDVQPGLEQLVQAGVGRASLLGDLWDVRVLTNASAPQRMGTSSTLLLLVTTLLALLAALVILAAPKLRTAVTVLSGRAVRVVPPPVDGADAARRR